MAEENVNWSAKGRAVCFTFNNYTIADVEYLSQLPLQYLCFGREVGESGTPHLQGFAYGENARSLRAWYQHLTYEPERPPYVRFKGKHSTFAQAIEYCKKDGEFTERGTPPVDPGQKGEKEKVRWDDIRAAAKEGRWDDIPSDVLIRNYHALRGIHKDFADEAEDADDVTGVWIHGPAGAGKSRLARERWPGAYKKKLTKWWDGYKGQEYVIVEDMDPFHRELGQDFKMWCDRYAFPAEIKNGQINIRPKKVIITSQYTIEQVWPDEETRDAVRRRCQIIAVGHDEQLFRRQRVENNRVDNFNPAN